MSAEERLRRSVVRNLRAGLRRVLKAVSLVVDSVAAGQPDLSGPGNERDPA